MSSSFGLFLVERGVLTRKNLYEALRLQRKTGGLLGTCLLELGFVRRGELLQSLATFLKVPPAAPSQVLNPDPGVAGLFEPSVLRRLRAVPYARGEGTTFVALADPRFRRAVDELGGDEKTGVVQTRIAIEPDISAALEMLFGPADAGEAARNYERVAPPRVIAAKKGLDLQALSGEDTDPEADPVGGRMSGGQDAPALSPGSRTEDEPQSSSFGNEDEVAFARATGFDRERTAVFRLDDLAAAHRAEEMAKSDKEAGAPEEEPLARPPSAPDLASTAEAIHQAEDEGAIAALVVQYLAAYFPRILLLTREGQEWRGLLASGLPSNDVETIRAPASAFARLFRERIGYYGPPPGGKELEPMYHALGSVAVNALVLPIECWSQPAWLVYADHADELRRYEDVHDLEMMAKEVSEALGARRSV